VPALNISSSFWFLATRVFSGAFRRQKKKCGFSLISCLGHLIDFFAKQVQVQEAFTATRLIEVVNTG
jgi:hypothetical protein